MQTLEVAQNDIPLNLRANLKYSDDTTVNLSGAAIHFHMRQIVGGVYTVTPKVDRACVIETPPGTDGWVYLVWASGDLDTIGRFRGEFQVTFPSGKIVTSNLVDIIVRQEMA